MPADISSKRACVVVDTCTWRAELLLNSPLGITLIYRISRSNSLLGIPEVVEMEMPDKIVAAGIEAANKARGPVQILKTIINEHFFVPDFPDADALRVHVAKRIAKLEGIIVREPFTHEHARAALEMVNAKQPPNGHNDQQFKDSAIWQAILSLADRFAVTFITGDRGFFENKDPKKGLAHNLLQDCKQRGVTVQAFEGIAHYLNALKEATPQFDSELIKNKILPEARSRLTTHGEPMQLAPTEMLSSEIAGYAMEDPDRVAVDYTLTFKMEPIPEDFRAFKNSKGLVHGSCYFTLSDNSIASNYIQRVVAKYDNGLSARTFKDYDDTFPFPRPLPWD